MPGTLVPPAATGRRVLLQVLRGWRGNFKLRPLKLDSGCARSEQRSDSGSRACH
jgi:hypothetical protein